MKNRKLSNICSTYKVKMKGLCMACIVAVDLAISRE